MDCQIRLEELSLYVDGELTAARRREIEPHLRACPACADKVDRLRLLSAELTRAPRIDMPRDAAGRMNAVIEAHLAVRAGGAQITRVAKSPGAAKNWFLRLGNPLFGAAAAAVAVVALAVVIWTSPPPAADLDLRQSAPARKMEAEQSSPDDEAQPQTEPPAASGVGTAESELFSPPPSFSPADLQELAATTERAVADRAVAALEEEALAAAQVVNGGRPVELLWASRGLYEDQDVWVVVFAEAGEPVIAAAVTPDGAVLYRTPKK